MSMEHWGKDWQERPGVARKGMARSDGEWIGRTGFDKTIMGEIMSANGEANAKQRIRDRYEATPPWPCQACGGLMKPPFGISWNNRKYCDKPECQRIKELNRQKSVKESMARRKYQPPYLSRTDGLSKAKDRKWPCQDCGRMSDNRLHCPECKDRRIARDGSWLDEYAIQSIDIASMGVMT